jgi:hypothetical protein
MIEFFFGLWLFSFFCQADLYGEFILTNEVGLFAPLKNTFFSLLFHKKSLLFLENSNKIILYGERLFKPLVFDAEGNYLGYLETVFYDAKKFEDKNKELIAVPFGNVLKFYRLKNKTLTFSQQLRLNEYIISFDFLKKRADSFLVILSLSDKKENKIRIYNQKFKLLTEKAIKEKIFVNNLFDTLILGITEDFKKIILWDIKLNTLWEFNLKNLLITDFATTDSFLILATSDQNKEKGLLYFLTLKNGKIFKTFPEDSFYLLGFSGVKVADLDNDGIKEVCVSAFGKKGEVLIFKWLKEKLIFKKRLSFPAQIPVRPEVNTFLLEINDFIEDKDKNKELLLLVTYEQKNSLPLPNNFIAGNILLLDNKLKDIAQLDLISPVSDYLVVSKKNKKENVLVVLAEKLKFYE